jgi:Fe-S oxidoreductase
MYETMDLCVSCKGCKRECPTGVDMARMKIEFLDHYHRRHGVSFREKLFAYLPRYAPKLKAVGFLLNLRDQVPGFAKISEWLLGVTSQRRLPRWRTDHFRVHGEDTEFEEGAKEVVLLVDTFNSCFESENASAAVDVLSAAGYRVHCPRPLDGGRSLCCGRTFLSNGMVDEAKVEVLRTMTTLKPYVERGVPIVGIEPSCLLTLRDEYLVLFPGEESKRLAQNSFMLEEFLANELDRGNLDLDLQALTTKKALLHGHCHQKAFAALSPVERVLNLIPDLEIKTIDSSCCGMAGSFGYEKEHYDASMEMGSLSLFPAINDAELDTLVVADGVSCRGQIEHGTGRQAMHVARVLQMALKTGN